VQPQVQRRTVRVHPFVVLVSVLCGAKLLGVLGALIAVPVAASIQIGIKEWWSYRQEQVEGTQQLPLPDAQSP
jgi:predicted PurR-regulated permease PerM